MASGLDKKAVVIVSGGLDSTTLLYHIIDMGYEPFVLSFNYGQRHLKEVECAMKICEELKVSFQSVDIRVINNLISKGSLSGTEKIPHGHYAAENMKSTIVPNRNMIMLSIAVGYAAKIGAEIVFYGAHHGDHTIYPDCRKEFAKALDSAVYLGNMWENDNRSISIKSPFIDLSKADIVKLGKELRVPFENTWSCYEGKKEACGKCGTCVERIEAFKLNKLKDPIKYKAKIKW